MPDASDFEQPLREPETRIAELAARAEMARLEDRLKFCRIGVFEDDARALATRG